MINAEIQLKIAKKRKSKCESDLTLSVSGPRLATETSLLRLGELQIDGLGCAGVDADGHGDVRMALRKIEGEIPVICARRNCKKQVISWNHAGNAVLASGVGPSGASIAGNPA